MCKLINIEKREIIHDIPSLSEFPPSSPVYDARDFGPSSFRKIKKSEPTLVTIFLPPSSLSLQRHFHSCFP